MHFGPFKLFRSLHRDITNDVQGIEVGSTSHEGFFDKSNALNDRWLLIFDNCDDQQLQFPIPSQRSIFITFQSVKLTFNKQLQLPRLEDINTGVSILSQRSGRVHSQGETNRELDTLYDYSLTSLDFDALHLGILSFGSLPLAVATAGACLRKTNNVDTKKLFEPRDIFSNWTIILDRFRSLKLDNAEQIKQALVSEGESTRTRPFLDS